MPSKRRVAVVLSFFVLLAIFFSVFQFYYIPSNKSKLHQYGFMLLNRIKANIIERDNDLRKYYSNLVEKELDKSSDAIRDSLRERNFTDRFIKTPSLQVCNSSKTIVDNAIDSCTGFGFVEDREGWLRVYSFRNNNRRDSFGLGLPVKDFLEPAFSYRKELFESYLVVNNCGIGGTVLYHDARLGVGDKILKDTLLLQNKSVNISHIYDINLKGMSYKMFTYPFEMGEQSLVLCGLVRAEKYSQSLRTIPAGLVYPVLIIIFVLLVMLPFIKPYLMSPQEKLNIKDPYLMISALFVGLTLITLLVIQALILGATAKKEKRELGLLTKHLETSFRSELYRAWRQLNYFDSSVSLLQQNKISDLPLSPSVLSVETRQNVPIIRHGSDFRLPVTDSARRERPYYFFERIAWVNSKGEQVIKGQVDEQSEYQFINVTERNYFRNLKEGHPNILPGSPGTAFVIDPIYSWTEGDFKVNISTNSRLGYPGKDTNMYAVLVTRFASLVQTIFPAGYGYCLVDEQGNVLTHSDMNRNLRENLLDETGNARILRESIASRQSYYINRIFLYGKPHALFISPLDQLPFHMVVFHDKTFRIPINLRILAFALVFMVVFCAIAILTLLVYRRIFGQKIAYSIFRPAIAYRTWMLPSHAQNHFYLLGIGLFIVYLALLGVCIFSTRLRPDNYVTLILTLMTPVNIFASLFSLGKMVKPATYRNRLLTQLAGWLCFLSFILITAIWGQFDDDDQRWYFLRFEIFWLLLPWVFWWIRRMKFSQRLIHNLKDELRPYYLTFYSVFIIMLLICFTIVPACVFTWYAHNYEIKQAVKKQQLYLAGSLQERRDGLRKFFRAHDSRSLSADFFKAAQYRYGVYTIYEDSLFEAAHVLNTEEAIQEYLDSIYQRKPGTVSAFKSTDRSETFYLDLADNLSRNYSDPSYYPALATHSADKSWYWLSSGNEICFYQGYPYINSFPDDPKAAPVPGIFIHSSMPPRFELISSWDYRLLIVVFTLALLALLVKLVWATAARIFVLDHSASPVQLCRPGMAQTTPYSNLFVDAVKTGNRLKGVKDTEVAIEYEILKNDSNLTDEELILLFEKHKKNFSRMWSEINDKEKMLLLDMAQDGLINYRNTEEIRELCNKGVLIVDDQRVRLFSYAFGYYLRTHKFDEEKKKLTEKFGQQGSWASFRAPLFMIILSIAVFIFVTQEDIWNKLIGLVGSLTAILTLLQRVIVSKGDGSKS